MPSQAWKNMERRVAKALQGTRIPRGANFSSSLPDVISDSSVTIPRSEGLILTECKHSQTNPWVDKISKAYDGRLLTIKEKDEQYLFFKLEDIYLLSGTDRYRKAEQIKGKVPKYIKDHLEQSRKYIKTITTDIVLKAVIQSKTGITNIKSYLPIVCIAKKHKEFKLACVSLSDLFAFYQHQNDQSYWKI